MNRNKTDTDVHKNTGLPTCYDNRRRMHSLNDVKKQPFKQTKFSYALRWKRNETEVDRQLRAICAILSKILISVLQKAFVECCCHRKLTFWRRLHQKSFSGRAPPGPPESASPDTLTRFGEGDRERKGWMREEKGWPVGPRVTVQF